MRPTEIYRGGRWIKVEDESRSEFHHVIPDLQEFRNTDGTMIGGRSQWREHLKRTGSVEMGHSDMKAAQANWDNRKDKFQSRLKRDTGVHEAQAPSEITEHQYSRINAEVRNRLDGRPEPDRKTLIKLTLETARDLARRI